MLTMHEFLSRLVSDPGARSAFEADPLGSLKQADLGEMSSTDVVQAASLMLDHAPVEIVEKLVRATQPGLARLGGNQHVALTYPLPSFVDGDNEMEHESMPTPDIFSSLGDVDRMMPSSETSNTDESTTTTETSEDTNGSNNPIGAGNEFQLDGLIGDINAGDVSGITNSGDINAGNVVGNGVTDVVGGVTDTVGGVEGGDVMGGLGDIAGAGDITGGLQDLGGVMPEVGDVTNALPVEGMTDLAPQGSLMAPVTGADGPVEGTVGDLAGGLDF
ncbi:IniB N-terminal domain-containing protein [Saccharopolyspora dendranthemae]|nr:IniB N-terminal domain-containing protein [Saccharopolyspora dendranthemae]